MTDIASRGDGCEICIDGRIQVSGGNVICDCKLTKDQPDRPQGQEINSINQK